MTGRLSIRARLTVWFSAVLAVCLCAAEITVWIALRQSVLASMDRDLQGRLAGLSRILETESPTGDTALVRIEMEEYAAGLTPDQSVRVWRDSGQLLFSWPSGSLEQFQTLRGRVNLSGQEFTLEIGTSLASSREMLRLLGLVMLACVPAVILLASVGGWWLSRRALAPVDAMTLEANRLGIQNLAARLPEPDTGDELARFARAWNGLLSRLQAAVERLSRFTADASHELRSPVALIRTTAELALRQDRPAGEYRRALAQIEAESRHMTELIEDLLALARSDEGTPDLQQVNLPAIVAQACAAKAGMAEGKGISLVVRTGEEVGEVLANPPMLRRLIELLVDNAVKYTPAGGIVEVAARGSESMVTLTVSDSGSGIAPEDLPHIFERFWRADPARSPGGAGLGLSLAKAIAEAHGGTLEVDSMPGQGSTFRFSVKRAVPEIESAPASAASHRLRSRV